MPLPIAVPAIVESAAARPACADATAFVGTICPPTGAGKHPAIVLLGGSEGGNIMSRVAPTFAARGFVAASVAYFGLPGLPATLEEIPVETVGKALDALAARDDVDPKKIAVFGVSKGGELALLAASTYPAIRAVVAVVPSPFAWQGIPSGDERVARSSWTVAGRPVPFVPDGPEMGVVAATVASTHAPLALRPAYDAAMADHAAVTKAFFPLERIAGPVLFLSAGDDRVWDSEAQARLGLDELRAHHHPYADAVQNYPLAGHLFAFATLERPMVTAPLGDGSTLALGGTPQANAEASADYGPRIGAFLTEALALNRPGGDAAP